MPVVRHYLWVAFPLTFVWLASLALRHGSRPLGRVLLLVLCLTQGLISAHLLSYIHGCGRPIRGDYGLPYRLQTTEHKYFLWLCVREDPPRPAP
jgi:hypothetical protein